LQAVILVGGEGTRLRPLTYGTPKPMVPLFGIPFLERTLGRLHAAGVDDVIMAAGYLPKAIEQHLGDGSRLGMRLRYVVEESPLGTAGALKNVADEITGPFFVLNGDILTGLDLSAMLEFHKRKGGMGVLHLTRVEDPSAFGCVVHDRDDRISAFIEKPPKGQEPTDEINAGTYLLERAVLDAIPEGKVSIERETFPKLIAAGERFYAFTTGDYWLDVGRPEQYMQAHRDVLDGKLTLGYLGEPPPPVVGPSFVGIDSSIDPSATIGPYAVLGARVKVGPGAIVRNSILWDDVVVEGGAKIDDAILADRVHVGHDAQIGTGTVIGHEVEIDSGSSIAPDSRLSAHEVAKT
jgi:mannose-1-phosphate guanylyltransferase